MKGVLLGAAVAVVLLGGTLSGPAGARPAGDGDPGPAGLESPPGQIVLQVGYRVEMTMEGGMLWGLVPAEHQHSEMDLRLRAVLAPREDGLFDLDLFLDAGRSVERGSGGRVTYQLPAPWRGRKVARARWDPRRKRMLDAEVLLQEGDLGLLGPNVVRSVLRGLQPEEPATREQSDKEGGRYVVRFGPFRASPGGDGFEQDGEVLVLIDGREAGRGTIRVVGRMDPHTGLCREKQEEMETKVTLKTVRVDTRSRKTIRTEPAGAQSARGD